MTNAHPVQRTLLCVLDWGLGHASRSLALATQLEAAGETVHFASCGRAQKFIAQERPELVIHELPAYRVTYPTRSMPLNVALQLPRWLQTIWRERRCIEKLVKAGKYDRIISDNRFGCYSTLVPSIFLTHQLHPITGNRFVSWLYRWYLQRFDAFWVPDYPIAEQRISRLLCSPTGYQNVRFIGPLSRLQFGALPVQAPFELLILLSGPEPMRTQLENIVVKQLSNLPGQHILVRGLPGGAPPMPQTPGQLTVYDFADKALLSRLIPAAGQILCRSGYSTLMDVYALVGGNNLILVPTPGQTEQIYLAEQAAQRTGCTFVREQEDLILRALF